MNESLGALRRIQGVHGAAIVSRDGQVIESSLGKGAEQEVTGSLAAAIFGAVGQALERLDLGDLSNCIFEGQHGAVHMLGSGDHVLLVVTAKQANVGLVRLGLQRAAAALIA